MGLLEAIVPVAAEGAAAPILSARGLAKNFGRIVGVAGVDLDLRPGTVTALLGDNGAGKSTLIAMLSGVMPPSGGGIQLDGASVRFDTPLAARAAGIATVFQNLSLVEDRSIAENLFLGVELVRFGFLVDRRRMQHEAKAVLERLRVNLPPVTTTVRYLSGGQRQSVAVARTLLHGSRIVILDEPTAALGVRETERVLDLIRRLRDQGRAVLLVSHNMDNVFEVADRAVVLRLGRKVADMAIAETSRAGLVGLIVGGVALNDGFHRVLDLLFSRQATMLAVVIALFVGFSAGAPHFLEADTQFEILRITAFTLIIGLPLTALVIAGEVDLSIGSNYGLCSVVCAMAIVNWSWNPWAAGALALALGAAIGLFNGLAVVRLKVPSFILTIGMLSLLRGLALVLTMGLSIDIPSSIESGFFSAAGGMAGPVPTQVLWASGMFLLSGLVLRHTLFGARLYATGGNPRAAMQMGVNPGRVKVWTFAALGLACGLVGALTAGWLRIGAPNTGSGNELSIIAAVIIGGAALSGGVGTAFGTLLGALIVSMLQTGLILTGVQGNWVQVGVGVLIVLAAGLEPHLRPDSALAERLRGIGRPLASGHA